MVRACEELRLLDGEKGAEDGKGGRLYRRAMEKRGVYGPGGWPIEAGKGMVEWPGREVWSGEWKR